MRAEPVTAETVRDKTKYMLTDPVAMEMLVKDLHGLAYALDAAIQSKQKMKPSRRQRNAVAAAMMILTHIAIEAANQLIEDDDD